MDDYTLRHLLKIQDTLDTLASQMVDIHEMTLSPVYLHMEKVKKKEQENK